MLQKFREHIQGWVAIVILILLTAAFMMWGVQYYIQESRAKEAALATVDGVSITKTQLNRAFQEIKRRRQAAAGGAAFNPAVLKQLKGFALQALITNTALLNSVRDAGFRVSLAQVKSLVMSLPEFQVGGQFSSQRFQQMVSMVGMTPDQYLRQLQGNILTSQLTQGVQGSAFVLPSELNQMLALIRQTRSFGYFVIPLSKFIAGVKISPQALQTYYQQNKSRYKTPEKVSVSYILISPDKISKSVKVSDDEIKDYYEGNKPNFTAPKRWQVARLIMTLPNNATQKQLESAQNELAKLIVDFKKGTITKPLPSTITQTKQWITQPEVTGALASMISKMQVGDTSRPFRSQEGLNVVKILKFEPQIIHPFKQVSGRIKKTLMQQKIRQIVATKVDTLTNMTYTNPSSLAPAAKALGIAVQTTPLMTRKGLPIGLFSQQNLLIVVFSDDVFKQGNNSDPVQLKNGASIVLRIHKIVPSKEKPFDSVKAQIEKQMTQQQAQRNAGLQAYKIQTALAAGTSPSNLAKQYQLTWTVKQNVQRDNKAIPQSLLSTIFALSPSQKKKPTITSIELKNGDFAVIQLTQTKLSDAKQIKPALKKVISLNMAHFRGQTDYRFYLKSVMNSAKVKINKQKQ